MPPIYAPDPPSALARVAHAVYSLLAAFPVACFTLALGTDLLYWQTSHLPFVEFSAWLLLAGLVVGVAAIPFSAIAFFTSDWEFRSQGSAVAHAIGRIVVLVLASVNNLVHAADGWAAILPWGLPLSALTVLAMLVTALVGAARFREPAYGGRRYV